MDKLLKAIIQADRALAMRILKADRGLAMAAVRRARLYDSGIFHWLYVGDTALHLAAAGYRFEIARLLLNAGADPNAHGNHRLGRPFHYAADGYIAHPSWNPKRQVQTLRVLLDAAAKIDAQDQNGATALHRAVRTRCAEAVRFLLDAGANPALPNKSGSTPFHLAVQNTGRGGTGAKAAIDAQREIIQTFLSRGVSAKLPGPNGKTVRASTRSAWILELLK